MDAKELIRAGRLADARAQLIADVKATPGDAAKRTLLFQVLLFLGEFEKAERHLDTLALQDPDRESGVQVYRNLLQAEKDRLLVVAGKERPTFLPETPPCLELYFDGWEKIQAGKIEDAVTVFSEIARDLGPVKGKVNGRPFTGLTDTDALLSYFLEAIVHERYVWIPFSAIREIIHPPPVSLFDLIWAPGTVTTWEGLTLNCFLPVLYANSFSHEDDRVKLGRMTDWLHLGGPFSTARGQHMYDFGDQEISLLEIQDVQFALS